MSKLPPKFPTESKWVQLLNPGQPFYGDQKMEGMYLMLINDPSLYRAYYEARVIPGLAHAAQTAGLTPGAEDFPIAKPMELILTSAHQAAQSGLVKPHERALVHLASIVSPCGLLISTQDLEHPQKSATPSWDEIESLRTSMLSRPLLKLKAVDVAMGNTLAAVLGQSYEQGDVNTDQVTRLVAAVRLSDTKLASYWAGQITSTSGSAI